MISAHAVDSARATSSYDYKQNEYAVIAGGAAPNKLLSIASHGGGKLGNDNFHLYLMAEFAQKIIAKLEAIGPNDVLDTAPDAFHAEWSADSRHVAVLYRPDRHVVTMQPYEIRDRRAHLLAGPDLLGNAPAWADDKEGVPPNRHLAFRERAFPPWANQVAGGIHQ